MIEKKNIDRLFQEKFKNFEAHPSDAVWNSILAAQKQKDDRKVIPLWWKLGGIAAGLAILLTIGLFSIDDPSNSSPSIVDQKIVPVNSEVDDQFDVSPSNGNETRQKVLLTENNDNVSKNQDEPSIQSPSTTYSTPNSASKSIAVIGKGNNQNKTSSTQRGEISNAVAMKTSKEVITTSESNSKKDTEDFVPLTPSLTSNQEVIAENVVQSKETNDQTEFPKTAISSDQSLTKGKDLVEEAKKIALGDEESVVVNVKKSSSDRWNVGAVAAPVYYGDFGGSGLDPRFKDNDKSGDVNLSYGVQVSYAVSPRLKVRGGVSNVDLSYTTNDISFATNNLSRTTQSKTFAQNARSLNIADGISKNSAAFEDIPSGGSIERRTNGTIEQRLKYVEVPLEAVYTLSDKRIGVAIIGGMSTLLLNNDEVFIQGEGGSQSLGSSSSVKDVSFTTNIGVGLDYKITDKLKFNLEPALKYQINGYENSAGDFKPYYLGVYSGVSFKF